MATPVPARADDLVGRRQELEALRSSLDAAGDGAGRLVLCAGEPGIGRAVVPLAIVAPRVTRTPAPTRLLERVEGGCSSTLHNFLK
ncbi:MAG: hypothetical protein M3R01_13570 [Actinomycetota bacterium]|nr:hypothetical protein [Actinomycetota bacterium]